MKKVIIEINKGRVENIITPEGVNVYVYDKDANAEEEIIRIVNKNYYSGEEINQKYKQNEKEYMKKCILNQIYRTILPEYNYNEAKTLYCSLEKAFQSVKTVLGDVCSIDQIMPVCLNDVETNKPFIIHDEKNIRFGFNPIVVIKEKYSQKELNTFLLGTILFNLYGFSYKYKHFSKQGYTKRKLNAVFSYKLYSLISQKTKNNKDFINVETMILDKYNKNNFIEEIINEMVDEDIIKYKRENYKYVPLLIDG